MYLYIIVKAEITEEQKEIRRQKAREYYIHKKDKVLNII